ncbi:class I SAM-dependent methyltransferase [Frigidibacter sp. MR17.24]|uniref:class I SAM-dependent methyltransferase n=1 Tax=Frigidibacter sp. MR17.24 TaxID=3127345 RepID=UPI0030129EC6
MTGTGGEQGTGDDPTLRFYETRAAEHAARAGGAADGELAGFVAALPRGARVLELGCGAGHDALAMLRAGIDLHPTDGAVAMAGLAAARLRAAGQARAVAVLRFGDLAAEAAFDGIWARAALLHVPRADLPGVLARVFRALRPGGVQVASFKAGVAEGRDAHGRLYSYPTAAELVAFYRASAGWEIETVTTRAGGSFDGPRGTDWIWIRARRPA